MKGKLIVIEGADGSGKATQTALLAKKLKSEGKNITTLSFPDYESDSSALIKMYLNGDFGTDANSVSPYAASLFYAADRYASYKKNWQKLYENGEILIADRYVTSNFAHQGVKVEKNSRADFLNWLADLEYDKLELPKPDIVIFLDMPPEVSLKLVKERAKNDAKKDIHEKDEVYLKKVYECYLEASKMFGWKKISCAKNNLPKNISDIENEVYDACKEVLL